MDLEEYASSHPDVLFSDAPLRRLDRPECKFTSNGLTYENPGSNLRARPLERGDFDKGYVSLLSQLTRVGDVNKERYEAQFDGMRKMAGCHYIVVVEDVSKSLVVCSATLLVERKFIHSAALRGRIEDVVVDEGYRKLKLGSYLIDLLAALSRELGCYKVTLDCKPPIAGFYEKCGFVNEGQCYLSMRFFD